MLVVCIAALDFNLYQLAVCGSEGYICADVYETLFSGSEGDRVVLSDPLGDNIGIVFD